MQGVVLIFLVAAAFVSGVAGGATNPLAKTIELLSSLEAKVIKEGEAEQKSFEEFTEWCDDVAANTKYEIKTLRAAKAKLEALIQKSTTDSDASADAIVKLAGSISAAEKELADATVIRDKERADFQAEEAELMEAVDALDRAIAILEREIAKNPALVQTQVDTSSVQKLVQSIGAIVDACGFSVPDQKQLLGLVQSRAQAEQGDKELDKADADLEELASGAPDPAAYKSHSSSIVDVLEDLKEKADAELADVRKAETTAQHNFDMLKQSLTDGIAADTKDKADETAAKSEADETKAHAEGDLAGTVKDLASAENTLSTAHATCSNGGSEHEASVLSRGEELKALATAKKILHETTGGAVTQTYSMLQLSAYSSLHTGADLANTEVVTIIKKLAKDHHSAALAQLASKISALIRFGAATGEDPFAKVKGLISNLIDRLVKEGEEEATEHGYCVSETEKTNAKLAELNEDLAKLTSKIDKAVAHSAALKSEVKELQAQLAELAHSQAEMDKIRGEQAEDYKVASSDLKAGLAGVKKALQVLRDYYGSAFLQTGHDKSSGAGESIIGILEVVEADFSKGLAEAEAEEAEAKKEYERVTQENKVTETLKSQDVKYKTAEYTSIDKAVADMSGDKETLSTELAAVMEYSAKLKQRCAPKHETYEERQRRRQAEIDGLKEALNILETETVFAQKSKRSLRGF